MKILLLRPALPEHLWLAKHFYTWECERDLSKVLPWESSAPHCMWMTCKGAAPWFCTCVTCRLHPIKEIKCYLGLDNGKWGRAIQKHKERNVATLVTWQNHSLIPVFPLHLWWSIDRSLLSSDTGCIMLWCAWRLAGKLEISSGVLRFLTHRKDIWANSDELILLRTTCLQTLSACQRARSPCYTGRMICLEYKWHLSL